MKLVSTDGSDLLVVSAIRQAGDDLLIEGTIMGAMPLKAILTPDQLRAGLRFANRGVIWTVLRALARRKRRRG